MKIKYRSGYAEGGFLDDGATVDPMSGNEVPTGSLQEEVRDDIPAQLSEGEFVVPADVVRFIGLDKLMKMRDSAKKGLASMEAEGQIGGSPSPQDMPMDRGMEMPLEDDDIAMDALIDGMDGEGFDEQAMNFAKGGMPTYESYTGRKFNEPETMQHLKYVNAEGDYITIPTLRGKALRPIPEGYTLYVPPEEGDIVDPPEEEEEVIKDTVNSGPNADAERTKAYRNDAGQDGYQADVNRSDRIRRDRSTKIESLASVNMSSGQMDIMYAALTPQAKMIYDTRFRDKSTRGFLDGTFAEGQSPTDLLITAQKTADTQNRMAGKKEPDSGFLPNGEPIDWAKAVKYVGAGLVLGPTGMVGSALKFMSDEEKATAKSTLTEVGKILGSIGEDSPFKNNTNQPFEIKNDPYAKLNQDYWKSFTGDVASEKRRLEEETKLNAYGHKIYKEPGSRSVWDDIAEVQANQANSEKVRADNAAAKIMDKATVDRAAQTAREREAKIASNKAAADAAAAVTGGGDGGGGGGGHPIATGVEQTKAEEAGFAGVSGGGGKAKGGLLTKADRPKVKKMRSDNTSGLAAKKKSKEKAKAKKGALAAKRT